LKEGEEGDYSLGEAHRQRRIRKKDPCLWEGNEGGKAPEGGKELGKKKKEGRTLESAPAEGKHSLREEEGAFRRVRGGEKVDREEEKLRFSLLLQDEGEGGRGGYFAQRGDYWANFRGGEKGNREGSKEEERSITSEKEKETVINRKGEEGESGKKKKGAFTFLPLRRKV